MATAKSTSNLNPSHMLRVRFHRGGFGGWTAKAVRTPRGNWVPRFYVLNWTGSRAPNVVIADIPQWLWDKAFKEDDSIMIINPENDKQWSD